MFLFCCALFPHISENWNSEASLPGTVSLDDEETVGELSSCKDTDNVVKVQLSLITS